VVELEESDNDGSDSTIEIVPPEPFQKPKPGEWGPRHRFKTFVCRLDFTPIRRPRTHNSGSSSVFSQLREVAHPSTETPSTKSTQKSTQSLLQKIRKSSNPTGPPEQGPNRLRRLFPHLKTPQPKPKE